MNKNKNYDESILLKNLLAIIHRDGGDYVAEFGMVKAVADGMKIVVELREFKDTIKDSGR